MELFCRNLKRKRERGRKEGGNGVFGNAGAQGRECANKEGDRKERGMGGKVGNRTESRRLEVGGSGAERDKFLR